MKLLIKIMTVAFAVFGCKTTIAQTTTDSLQLRSSGNLVKLLAQPSTAAYSIQLPASVPAKRQFLGISSVTGTTGIGAWMDSTAFQNTYWSLTGNAGTTPSSSAYGSSVNNNFIGTTDPKDWVVATNNLERMRVLSGSTANTDGDVVIGTQTAATVASTTSGSSAAQQLAKLTVSGGDASINGLTIGLGGGQVSTNIAIGANALNNAGGAVNRNNIAIGFNALAVQTNSNGNIAIGANSLAANTTGGGNGAIGQDALSKNTTGYNNWAIGRSALLNNITGYYNIGVGELTMQANTTGNYNLALGPLALTSNSTGSNNVAMGYQALKNNSTGNYNTAIGGANPLYFNVAGSGGVAIGYQSQFYVNNTTTAWTNYNTSVGYQSLMGSITPASNTGNYNTVVGYQALVANTSGSNNTALGYKAGYNITTGNTNTAIGANVTDMADNTASNQLNIGNTIFGTRMTGTVSAPAGAVGINTTAPNATLEVAGKPATTTEMDGIIAPKITGDQLKAKTYAAAQNGSIVYVTAAASTANQTGQTINVTLPGYYYFDGTALVWYRLLSNNDVKTYNIPSNAFSAEKSADDATAIFNDPVNKMAFDKINLAVAQPAGYGWQSDNATYKIYYPGVYVITAGVGVRPIAAGNSYSIQIHAGPSGNRSFTIAAGTPINYNGNCSFGNATYVALLAKDDVINVYYAKAATNLTAFGELAHSFIHIVFTAK